MSDTAASLPPAFKRLAWSNLLAQSADQIALAAAPLVAVLSFGASTAQTGLLQMAQTLPFLLLAIPAGLLADRLSRRALMCGAEGIRLASLLAILALAQLGLLSIPLLWLLAFVGASGTVAYSVAAPALLPSLVGPQSLARANARIELARTSAYAGGPALAGALLGWSGTEIAFAAAAGLSAGAVVLLGGINEPARAPVAERHPWRDLREGMNFVFGHKMLQPIFMTQLIFGVAQFVLLSAYVPYAVNVLGLSAGGIGLTLGALGAGMVVGALAAGAIISRLNFGVVVGIGPCTGFVASMIMVLTLWVPSGLLAGLSFFLLGAGPILWVISTTTLRQTVTPARLLGRVSAINILAYGARPLGAGIAALVGGISGPEACLVVAAAGFAVQAGVILISAVPRLEALPQACPA